MRSPTGYRIASDFSLVQEAPNINATYGAGAYIHHRLSNVSDGMTTYDSILALLPSQETQQFHADAAFAELNPNGQLVPVSDRGIKWIRQYDVLVSQAIERELKLSMEDSININNDTQPIELQHIAYDLVPILQGLKSENPILLSLFFHRLSLDLSNLARHAIS